MRSPAVVVALLLAVASSHASESETTIALPGSVERALAVSQFPVLHDASLIGLRNGMPHQATFERVDATSLRSLASAVFQHVVADTGATLETLAPRPGDPPGMERMQLEVDGRPVHGSGVVIETETDGSGAYSSTLVPVRRNSSPIRRPKEVLQAARSSLKERQSVPRRIPEQVDGEPKYVIHDGEARLAYRALGAPPLPDTYYLDAESGAVLSVRDAMDRFDSIPSDIYWSMPPWIWNGLEPSTGEPITCKIDYQIAKPTPYYPSAPFLLLPTSPQLNTTGPGIRIRDPDLGLTVASWRRPWAHFLSNNYWKDWGSVEARIFGDAVVEKCGSGFPAPAGAGPLFPYDVETVTQEREVRSALVALEDRFGGWGFRYRKPLVLIPDIPDLEEESCAIVSDGIDRPFDMIVCPLDAEPLKNGQPERIPPIEIFAHEVAHLAITPWRRPGDGFEHEIVAEALVDMLAAYVDSRHDVDYWKLGDRAPFMERIKKYRCDWHGSECGVPPRAAIRDLAHPKTMNEVKPSPEFWRGEHWGFEYADEHRKSQVLSHMLVRLAEGDSAGARDDNLALGTYEAYEGIGFEPMMEILENIKRGLPAIMSSSNPQRELVSQLRISASQLCGTWSREELLISKVAWIAGVTNNYTVEPGYLAPLDGDFALPSTTLRFHGERGHYELQLASDQEFTDIVHTALVKVDDQDVGELAVELDGNAEYWWRVRRAKAPMMFSPWVTQDLDRLCWRRAASFRTAGLKDLSPAQDDLEEPWTVRLAWTGNSLWTGYEFWVDDEESPLGRYTNVWAHRVLTKELLPDPEDPGTKAEPNFRLPPIPLPSSRKLCWKLVPFATIKGDRVDGEAEERCFTTTTPKTIIKSPAQNAEVPAQPLTIDYDPADGAARHEFSLEVLELAGDSAPPAQGAWAYVDNADGDEGNIVKEEANPPDWTHRTRQRMLPVQLEMTPFINFELGKVRLAVTSYSPTISSSENGGTYAEMHEKTSEASVSFRPADPINFVALHPFVTAPPAMDSCSSSTNTDLFVEWNHGIDATADVVESYELELYKERCNNLHPVGCFPMMDVFSPHFGNSLYMRKVVKHNGLASQSVGFDRGELFPTWIEEESETTGFLVNLHGVSGPSPGPAGLNITGSFLVDLPVLPDSLTPMLTFFDGGPDSPHSNFQAAVETRKTPLVALGSQSQYAYPDNHVVIEMYKGAHCDPEQVLTHNRDDPSENLLSIPLGDEAFANETNPVVSVRAEMTYGGMACKKVESDCVSKTGVNYESKPKDIEGLAVTEADGQLGVVWNAPIDPNPASLVYTVTLKAADDLSKNVLVSHPGPQDFAYPTLEDIGGKRGRQQVTSLDPLDQGKQLLVRVKACRQLSGRCSAEATLLHQVGSGDPSALPMPPEFVEVHPADGGTAGDWDWLDDSIFDYGAITVSWEPPSAGPAPTYYLIGFSSLGEVPGVLPAWIDSLGVEGAEYPGAAEQYATVVPASPDGMVFSSTPWGSYVMPLAITDPAQAPESGTWVTANVWACVGQVPLPPLKAFGWITGASVATCTGPVAHSAVTP